MPPPNSAMKTGAKVVPPKKAKETNGNGTASTSTVPAAETTNGSPEHDDKKSGAGKPDQAKYNADQEAVSKEIAEVKTKLVRSQPSPYLGSQSVTRLTMPGSPWWFGTVLKLIRLSRTPFAPALPSRKRLARLTVAVSSKPRWMA